MLKMQTFRNALLTFIDKSGLNLAEIARGAGVSHEQLKKIKQRETASTNVEDAVKIARFFGLTIDEFLGDHSAAQRLEILDLYTQLSDEERGFLLDVARQRVLRGHAAD